MPPDELAALIAPLPHYRAMQIIKWIASGAASFSEMNNLPLSMREELGKRFILRPVCEKTVLSGNDNTAKVILKFRDGAAIEAVLLKDEADQSARYTACLSTQAGCPAACVFCKTGTAFRRNLSSSEITEQFLHLTELQQLSNVVIMGMGEPLLNLAELRRALQVINCAKGINFSKRRITVSTCGIINGISDLGENGPLVRLALSLPTGDEKLRQKLMPITAGQALNKVKKALCNFQEKGGGRITLETVLLGDINTRIEDAHSIAKFAAGLDTMINLIPWNPVDGLKFEGKALCEPLAEEVTRYTRQLEAFGLKVTRRFRRGRGISGACGQLGGPVKT